MHGRRASRCESPGRLSHAIYRLARSLALRRTDVREDCDRLRPAPCLRDLQGLFEGHTVEVEAEDVGLASGQVRQVSSSALSIPRFGRRLLFDSAWPSTRGEGDEATTVGTHGAGYHHVFEWVKFVPPSVRRVKHEV